MARGFASMTVEERRRASSKGGRTAHKRKTAHQWTRDEAVRAGRKGGQVTQARLKAKAEDDAQRASEAYEQ